MLPIDRLAVNKCNSKASPRTRVHTNLLPDPPLGDPLTAAVVVLALNPSFDEDTAEEHKDPWQEHEFRIAMATPEDFFWLRDDVAHTGGGRWWRNKLAPLIEATSVEAVRRHVAAGHLHQCHSKSSSPLLRPPSGRYNLEVIRKALGSGIPALVLTGLPSWRVADSAFRDAPFYEPRSPQSMVVSPKNMPEGFPVAVNAVSTALRETD